LNMRTDSYQGLGPHGFHRIVFYDWGDLDNPHVVICVHGLTRNGRDFDFLAQALARHCRVVCPDVVGRGNSEWLTHKEQYGYPLYLTDMAALIARASARNGAAGFSPRALLRKFSGRDHGPCIDWVGTSMGGLIGIMLAAQPNSPLRRLVINDIGALVPASALQRIGAYVGSDPRFSSLAELESYLRQIYAPFGPLSDAQWQHLALHGARRHEDGAWRFVYDPGIALAFSAPVLHDINIWPVWDRIKCPTLILRGADSDLLLPETAREMLTHGPKSRLIEFPGVGHAPMLMSEDQIAPVREFLLRD
jgi:pimeloyl-ACP methyl ester carboxylesterase